MDDAARKEQKKQRVAKRRKKIREKAALEKRQVDRKAKGRTINLKDAAPVPPRNGPCPLHPEFKFKKCPHNCMEMFKRNRARHAGDVYIVHVAEDDERKGKIGREIDPAVGAMNDLSQIMADDF